MPITRRIGDWTPANQRLPGALRLAPVADEAARAYIFKRMAAEGRARIVQYHLPEPSLDVWLAHTAPDKAWLAAILDSGTGSGAVSAGGACEASLSGRRCERLAAAAWFTDFTGKTAFAHFVIFRGYERMSRRICHLACRWAFASAVGDSLTDEDSRDAWTGTGTAPRIRSLPSRKSCTCP
jgi:hypothetical protein